MNKVFFKMCDTVMREREELEEDAEAFAVQKPWNSRVHRFVCNHTLNILLDLFNVFIILGKQDPRRRRRSALPTSRYRCSFMVFDEFILF